MPRSQEDFVRRLQGIQSASASDQAELEDYARTGGERGASHKLMRGTALGGLGALAGYGAGKLTKMPITSVLRAASRHVPDKALTRVTGFSGPGLARAAEPMGMLGSHAASKAMGLAGLGTGAVAGATGKAPIPSAEETEEALREAFEAYPQEMMYLMKGGGMDPLQIKENLEKSAQLVRDTSAQAKKLQQERDAALEKVAEFERENQIQTLAKKMEEKGFWSDQGIEEKVASLRNSKDLNALDELVENQGTPIKLASVSDEYRKVSPGMKSSDLTRERLKDFIHSD
jgi:hypothetical protein